MERSSDRTRGHKTRKKDCRRTIFRGESGFSLLEGMVASAVLGLGILAVAAMQGVVATSTSRAHLQTMGASLAESRMEEIKVWCQRPVVSIVPPEGKVGCPDTGTNGWQSEELNSLGEVMIDAQPGTGTFTRRWNITVPWPGARQATVEVSWGARVSPGSPRDIGSAGFSGLVEKRAVINAIIWQIV